MSSVRSHFGSSQAFKLVCGLCSCVLLHDTMEDTKLRPPPLTPRGSVGTLPRTPRGSVAQELPKVSDSSGTGDTSGFQELPKVGVVDVAPVTPVALVGESRAQRKKHRDRLRASAKQNELPYPVCYNPHGYLEVPDICNRIATDWGKAPAGCMCATQWPAFLAAAYASGQAKRVQSAVCYDGALTLEPGQKVTASYRRPGGHNMGEVWWYNAVVESFVDIMSKTGHSSTIAIVN
jgi:hypothetical protein